MTDALTEEYLSIMAELDGDEAGRRAAWRRMGESEAYYHGEPIAFSFVPCLYDEDMRAFLRKTALTTYGILAKVIRRYREDENYRREFRFDPRVEELVMVANPYDEPVPFARIDLLLDEETHEFKFVEFNTDASSGMHESRESLAAIRESETYRHFAEQHRLADDGERQIEGLVADFARIYEKAVADEGESHPKSQTQPRPQPHARPHVAIVALFDSPDPEIGELECYRCCFEEAGFACSIFDVRELEFDGERLVGRRALSGDDDFEIDAIWRYAIMVDLLAHWDEVQPFIEAVRRGRVVMIGGFSTQIVHDKQLFAILRRPATLDMLTEDERSFIDAHIPATYFLDDPALDLEDLRRNKDRWVIKPTDWYASNYVFAGPDVSVEEWERAIEDAKGHECGSRFLVQEFCAPERHLVVPLYGKESEFTTPPQEFGTIIGLYLFGGDFAGLYVRQGPHAVIGSAREGLVGPVLWVDCDENENS